MIRTFLATTAMATLLASGAMAQTTTAPTTGSGTAGSAAQPAQPMVKKAEGHLASDVMGKSVYNGTGDDAENIGEVNDIVLDKDGKIKAIVVGVGGFLGIGEKSVALEYGLVEWTKKGDEEWLVVDTTTDALKAQPEFDSAAYEPMPADSDVTETKPATKEDLDNAPKADAGDDAAAGSGAATGAAAGNDAAASGDSMKSDDAAGSDDAMKSDDAAGSGDAMKSDDAAGSGDAMKSDDAAGSGDDTKKK